MFTEGKDQGIFIISLIFAIGGLATYWLVERMQVVKQILGLLPSLDQSGHDVP